MTIVNHSMRAAGEVDGGRQPDHHRAVSKRSGNGSSLNHLFSSGWTRLEAMPRWMIRNTMELIQGVPSSNFHTKKNHHRPHHSATVQRLLRDCDSTNGELPLDDSDVDLSFLKQKYAKDIKADASTQALCKQIRQLKQDLALQRSQREKLARKQASILEKEQKQLDQYRQKLKQALEHSITSSKSHRDYTKALLRATNRRLKRSLSSGAGSGTPPASALLQKIKLSSYASGTASIVGMKPMTTSSSTLGPVEQKALSMELSLIQSMHRTLVAQNQGDVAQKYATELTSSLKRIRAGLDDENAQRAMYQMILTGTERALIVLYPELVAMQKWIIREKSTTTSAAAATNPVFANEACKTGRALLLLDQKQQNNNVSVSTLGAGSSMNSSIPRVIEPHQKQRRRPSLRMSSQASTSTSSSFSDTKTRRSFVSTTRSDGVSDLGESMAEVVSAAAAVGGYRGHDSIGEEGEEGGSMGTSTHLRNDVFKPPGGPVFASVEALQQQTLQQRAATGVC